MLMGMRFFLAPHIQRKRCQLVLLVEMHSGFPTHLLCLMGLFFASPSALKNCLILVRSSGYRVTGSGVFNDGRVSNA